MNESYRTMRQLLIISFLFLIMMLPVMVTGEEDSYPPMPDYERLTPSRDILFPHDYKQVVGDVTIFDAPYGYAIGTRKSGFYYASVNRYQDGWAEINPNEWIPAEQLIEPMVSHLGGILLDEAPQQAIGILHESAQVYSEPNIKSEYLASDIIAQYQALFVLDESESDGTHWVSIGDNAWIQRSSIRLIAPVSRPADIVSERWIGIDLAEQVLIAYEGETPVFATLISSGMDGVETDAGIFRTFSRFNPRDMRLNSEVYPPGYHMEDVPYTFYFNGAQALHGTYWHNEFGRRYSHGCINLSMSDADWLYNFLSDELDVSDENAIWPMVYVY